MSAEAQPAPPPSKLDPAERKRLAQELLAMREVGRTMSRTRLEAWCYHYLPGQFTDAPGDFHRGIYRDLEAMLWQRPIEGTVRDAAAMAYPRGHGKTTVATLGTVAYVICEWQRMPHFKGSPPFILIVSDTLAQARDRALDLRDELEANERIAADYGELAPQLEQRETRSRGTRGPKTGRVKWTETDFTTSTGVRVKAVGAGSKVRGLLRRGRRPTLIVIDDLENDQHVQTKEQRAKLEAWMVKALIPTGIEGSVMTLMVGTILHADSLLSKLLDPARYQGWLKRRFSALYNEAGLPDAEGSIPLWAAKWPVDRLRARRDKIGSVAFAQEYLNIAIDDLSSLFKWAWLQAALQRGRGTGFLYEPPPRISFAAATATWDYLELVEATPVDAYQVVVTAWDLGLVEDAETAREKDSDYTVGITVGLTAADRLELRRVFRKRGMTPGQVRERVVSEQGIVGADYVVVENNAAQRLHEIELRGVPNLPIKGHTTDKKKHSVYEGVPGMALLFESGRIDLCHEDPRERDKLEALLTELHGLGAEAHDDCVMALWMAVVMIRRWMRMRDQQRRKLLGPPPPSYVDPFPTRQEAEAA